MRPRLCPSPVCLRFRPCWPWSGGLGGSVTLPGTRIEGCGPHTGCFTSETRCVGSVKRSDNRRLVRILQRFLRHAWRVLCTRYPGAPGVTCVSGLGWVGRRRRTGARYASKSDQNWAFFACGDPRRTAWTDRSAVGNARPRRRRAFSVAAARGAACPAYSAGTAGPVGRLPDAAASRA